jgi:hypothetical protein
MPVFRILCLASGLLERSEETEAEDVVEVLAGKSLDDGFERIEVWPDDRRVAVLRPAGVKPDKLPVPAG